MSYSRKKETREGAALNAKWGFSEKQWSLAFKGSVKKMLYKCPQF